MQNADIVPLKVEQRSLRAGLAPLPIVVAPRCQPICRARRLVRHDHRWGALSPLVSSNHTFVPEGRSLGARTRSLLLPRQLPGVRRRTRGAVGDRRCCLWQAQPESYCRGGDSQGKSSVSCWSLTLNGRPSQS